MVAVFILAKTPLNRYISYQGCSVRTRIKGEIGEKTGVCLREKGYKSAPALEKLKCL
jgi:hypothetical protein